MDSPQNPEMELKHIRKTAYTIKRALLTTAYCVLVCTAVLSSFKSLFMTFADSVSGASVEVLSKMGTRGDEVKKIQSALKSLGFDPGGIDGIYGIKTQDAVLKFQRSRGLIVDGIAGNQTLRALGIYIDASAAAAENDVNLLARLISAESRGEPYQGQVAVGAVVLNRVKHPSFPNTISDVIYQPKAFSCIADGQFYRPVAESAYRAARDALNNHDPSGGAIYFYNPKRTSNVWIRSRSIITSIGAHVFCS